MASLEENGNFSRFFLFNSTVAPTCVFFHMYYHNDCIFHHQTNRQAPSRGMGNISYHDSSKYDRDIRHMVSSQTKHKKVFNRKATERCYLKYKTCLLLGVRSCKCIQLCFQYGIQYWLFAQGWTTTISLCTLHNYCNTFNGDFLLCWTTWILKFVWKIQF